MEEASYCPLSFYCFKSKRCYSTILDNIVLCTATRSVRDCSTFTVRLISRSVPEPNVFLLPMQSLRPSTSLIKTVFCLLILVSCLNQSI